MVVSTNAVQCSGCAPRCPSISVISPDSWHDFGVGVGRSGCRVMMTIACTARGCFHPPRRRSTVRWHTRQSEPTEHHAGLGSPNIVELQDLAADPDSTLDDLFRLRVDQITTSIVFVEVIKPVSFGDSRLNSAGTRLTDLLEERLDQARRTGKIRESVTAEDVILAIAMFAAIMKRTAESSRKEVAHFAWNLLVQGLAGSAAAG
ncbi:hypothetical protein QM716_29055 [Rhodococcus sp. IEGM 1409]|uniref:hypothetical protein n=1 Tax=Rhodococcus sp. IEGM 1409 TaxID=3047082 RepID=UPI0024B65FD5|nr:hypothetical protein [Rhodococcus sp. IEGM 1409]MDI9903919.1 hypothetical protein [Rhodococcus sp. IEGM 1409]